MTRLVEVFSINEVQSETTTCDECGQIRHRGHPCEHCGVCPECGSTEDEPPSFDCHLCDRKGIG